jgi:hypothetical protein
MLDHECTKPVEQLKGEFVKRKADAKKVYRVDGYNREAKRYELTDTEDACRTILVKKGTLLFAGFDY